MCRTSICRPSLRRPSLERRLATAIARRRFLEIRSIAVRAVEQRSVQRERAAVGCGLGPVCARRARFVLIGRSIGCIVAPNGREQSTALGPSIRPGHVRPPASETVPIRFSAGFPASRRSSNRRGSPRRCIETTSHTNHIIFPLPISPVHVTTIVVNGVSVPASPLRCAIRHGRWPVRQCPGVIGRELP